MLVPSGQLGVESARLADALRGVRSWVAGAVSAVSIKITDSPAQGAASVLSFPDGYTVIPGGDPALERVLLITGQALVQRVDAGLYAQRADEVIAALILGSLVFDACSNPQTGNAAGAQVTLNGSPVIGPTGEGKADIAIRIPWRLRICLRIADDTEDTTP